MSDIRSLAAGIRAVAIVFTLILSYSNVWLALHINNFKAIFADMLSNRPLPLLTSFIVNSQWLFVALAFALPIFAIAIAIRVRDHKKALYLVSGIVAATFILIHITWTGLVAPLTSIISGLQSTQ